LSVFAKIAYNACFTVVYVLPLRPISISGLKRYPCHYGEVAGNLHIEITNSLSDLPVELASNQRMRIPEEKERL
jgi:hypothetical protein